MSFIWPLVMLCCEADKVKGGPVGPRDLTRQMKFLSCPSLIFLPSLELGCALIFIGMRSHNDDLVLVPFCRLPLGRLLKANANLL